MQYVTHALILLFTIMKIGIIGAGNMGGAIARGIAHSTGHVLTVSSPNRHGELDSLKSEVEALKQAVAEMRDLMNWQEGESGGEIQ